MANVVIVLSKMKMDCKVGDAYAAKLSTLLGVPWSKRDEISYQHSTRQDQHAALAQYLLYSLPGFSWATFAGALYYCKERTALQQARRYINREEGELCVVVINPRHNRDRVTVAVVGFGSVHVSVQLR